MTISDHEMDDLRRLAERVANLLAESARCERLDEGDAVEVLTDARTVLSRVTRPPIVVTVRDGVIQAVENVPGDIVVEVRDYDGDGEAGDRDDEGTACAVSRYVREGDL